MLRAERIDAKLAELPDGFYQAVEAEIESMKGTAELEDVLLIKSTFQRIASQRIKKVVRAAMSDAFLAVPQHAKEHFQPKEREFYERIIEGARALVPG